MSNTAQRFSLEQTAVRGCYVKLTTAATELLDTASYPASVRQLLLEFTGAITTVNSLSQFEGTMTLQGRSDEGIELIMAEQRSGGKFRGIARGYDTVNGNNLRSLLPEGIMALTLDPKVGQRYQGLIGIEQNSLAHCLQDYFEQSEQLRTLIRLYPSNEGVCGLILQAMPETEHSKVTDEDWQTVVTLADTLTTDETTQLEDTDVLFRLFHEFGVRVYDKQALQYNCGCSKERMAAAIATLDEQELRQFIEEDGKLQLNCDFCNSSYNFFDEDLNKIFKTSSNGTENDSVKKLH